MSKKQSWHFSLYNYLTAFFLTLFVAAMALFSNMPEKASAEGDTTYTVTIDPSSYGTVAGGGNYAPGETVTITAVPDDEHLFSYFGIRGINGAPSGTVYRYQSPFSFTMPSWDVTVYIYFRNKPRYSVSFRANGGSGTPPQTQTITSGKTIILPAATQLTPPSDWYIESLDILFEPDGHRLATGYSSGSYSASSVTKRCAIHRHYTNQDGWLEGNNESAFYANGEEYTVTKNVSMFAHWNSELVYSEVTAPLIEYGANSAFHGWFTERNGQGELRIADNGGTYTPEQAETLYPYFTTTANTYPVTYEDYENDGGTLPPNQVKVEGEPLYLRKNEGNLTRSDTFNRTITFVSNTEPAVDIPDAILTYNYRFSGWSTSPGGARAYYAYGKYNDDAPVTLYPFWEVYFKTSFYLPDPGENPDQTLMCSGWYTEPEGGHKVGNVGGSISASNQYITEANTTLYAHWEKKFTIIIDKNGGVATYNDVPDSVTIPYGNTFYPSNYSLTKENANDDITATFSLGQYGKGFGDYSGYPVNQRYLGITTFEDGTTENKKQAINTLVSYKYNSYNWSSDPPPENRTNAFGELNTNNYNPADSPITIHAHYTKNTVDANGVEVVAPIVIMPDGFTFDGWYYGTSKLISENGGSCFINRDLTLDLKLTPKTVHVTYEYGPHNVSGNLPAQQTGDYMSRFRPAKNCLTRPNETITVSFDTQGGNATISSVQQDVWFEQYGWSTLQDKQVFNEYRDGDDHYIYEAAGSRSMFDMTLYPVWRPRNASTGNYFRISYLPSPGTRDGYRFDAWYTEPNGQGELMGKTNYQSPLIDRSMTLYANWNEIKHLNFEVYPAFEKRPNQAERLWYEYLPNITKINDWGDVNIGVDDTYDAILGEKFRISLTREDERPLKFVKYIVSGALNFETDEREFEITMPDGDVTITAVYEEYNPYTIHFDTNGNTDGVVLDDITSVGSGTLAFEGKKIPDTILKKEVAHNNATVTFDSDGGSITPDSIEGEWVNVYALQRYEKVGTGSYYEPGKSDFILNEDMTLRAYYNESDAIDKYFKPNIQLPSPGTKDGYEFGGWEYYYDHRYYYAGMPGESLKIDDDLYGQTEITLSAKWHQKNDDGSSPFSEIKYAVTLYGIDHDTGEYGQTLPLTFGPATGADYTDEYVSSTHNGADHSGVTALGNQHRCIHDDSWALIGYWASTDPYVYECCIGDATHQSCTKSVYITANSYINGETFKTYGSGDGITSLYYEIADSYSYYDYLSWAIDSSYGGEAGRMGWRLSGLRGWLNGGQNERFEDEGYYSYITTNPDAGYWKRTKTSQGNLWSTLCTQDGTRVNSGVNQTYVVTGENTPESKMFLSAIEDDLRRIIAKKASKTTLKYGTTQTTQEATEDSNGIEVLIPKTFISYDYLWLPSASEIGLSLIADDSGDESFIENYPWLSSEGEQYQRFSQGNNIELFTYRNGDGIVEDPYGNNRYYNMPTDYRQNRSVSYLPLRTSIPSSLVGNEGNTTQGIYRTSKYDDNLVINQNGGFSEGPLNGLSFAFCIGADNAGTYNLILENGVGGKIVSDYMTSEENTFILPKTEDLQLTSGCGIIEWNTNADGSGESYTPGDIYSIPDGQNSATLYAIGMTATKYAVMIYGINTDTAYRNVVISDEQFQQPEGDEQVVGLTFGPAATGNYMKTYVSHEPSGQTAQGNEHRCVHNDDWATIAHWSRIDPYVYEQCQRNGCTHSVIVFIPDKIASSNIPALATGDGSSVITTPIKTLDRYWFGDFYSKSDLESDTSVGFNPLWGGSRVRNILNGNANYMLSYQGSDWPVGIKNGVSVAGADIWDSNLMGQWAAEDSIIENLEPSLKTNILYKKNERNPYYNRGTTTYDKLWLFDTEYSDYRGKYPEVLSSDTLSNGFGWGGYGYNVVGSDGKTNCHSFVSYAPSWTPEICDECGDTILLHPDYMSVEDYDKYGISFAFCIEENSDTPLQILELDTGYRRFLVPQKFYRSESNTFIVPDAPTNLGEMTKFISWNTEKDGSGTVYNPGDEITIPDNEHVILYAQYSNITVYWVALESIKQDIGENGLPVGLTFIPATAHYEIGRDYSQDKRLAHNGTTEKGNAYRCVREDVENGGWELVAFWAKEDPYVYSGCLEQGSSRACNAPVLIDFSNSILSSGISYVPEKDSGEGAFFSVIKNSYRSWNYKDSISGGWKFSRIRSVLNGNEETQFSQIREKGSVLGTYNVTNHVAGNDMYLVTDRGVGGVTTVQGIWPVENSIFSLLPEELQQAIIPKKTITYRSLTTSDEFMDVTYDKLWLETPASVSHYSVLYSDASYASNTVWTAAIGTYRSNYGRTETGIVTSSGSSFGPYNYSDVAINFGFCLEGRQDDGMKTVKFITNGGYMESTMITTAEQEITLPEPSRIGYIFDGWNTAEDGTGNVYPANSTFVMPSQDVTTLYAMWSQDNRVGYTVKVYKQNNNLNGYTLASTYSIPFAGNAGEEFVTAVPPGYANYRTPQPVTITLLENDGAVAEYYFDYMAYTLSYDGNGADSGQMLDTQTVKIDATVQVKDNQYAKRGYLFNGWNTKPDGTGASYAARASVTRIGQDGENVVLYAQWLKNENGTTPTSGKMTVKVKAGQSIVIPDLPAGTRYTITEVAQPDGWRQVGEVTNGTGVIKTQQTSSAYAVNEYSAEGNAYVVAHKATAGLPLNEGDYSFSLGEPEYARVPMTKYSHSYNLDDEGNKKYDYYSYTSTTQAVNIPGAEELHVTITYGTKSANDWVCVWSGKRSSMGTAYSGSISGKLSGGTSSNQTNTKEYTIPGEWVSFSFYSGYGSYSAYGYGYYAVVTGIGEDKNSVVGIKDGNVVSTVTNDAIDNTEEIPGPSEDTVPNPWYQTAPVHFEPITFTEPGTYTYAIIENQVSPYDKVQYDTHAEKVTINVTDAGGGKLNTEVVYDEDGALFTNRKRAPQPFDSLGAVTLLKEIENDVTRYGDTEFPFTALFYDEDGVELQPDVEFPATFYDSNMTPTEFNIYNGYEFNLKHGEMIVVPDLPPEITYHFVEGQVPGWTITQSDNVENVIIADTTQDAYTRSVYSASGTLEVLVTKNLRGGDLSTMPFTFELLNGSGDVIGRATTLDNDGTEPGIAKFLLDYYTNDIDGTYTYYINEVPGDVEGMQYDDHTEIITVSVLDKRDGTLDIQMNTDADGLSFTNVYSDSITVTKMVGGNMGSGTKKFDINISMTKASGAPLTGTYPASGTYDSVTFNESGVATVKLSHQDSVTIDNIPIGTTFTVSEPKTGAYETQIDNPTGTIKEGGTSVVVTNILQQEIPTGINFTNAGLIGLVIIIGIGLILLYGKPRKKKEEE